MIKTQTDKGGDLIKSISELLESRDIEPYITRIKILKYLIEGADHPSADEIYVQLATEIPTLSKTTVYNVLKLLVSKGLVRVVYLGGNRHHYDANTTDHGHFRCKICGQIYDFQVNMKDLMTEDLPDFQIEERNIYYKGICPGCFSGNVNKAADDTGNN